MNPAVPVATAIIAEDEPPIRSEIRDLLTQLWPELAVLAEVGDGVEALSAVERFAPRLVFLDIQMPGLDGLTVARRLGGRAHVVFITAFDRFAVDAFEQGALDYLLKPVAVERLRRTVERLRSRLAGPPADLAQISGLLQQLLPQESRYLKWLTVPHREELRVVAVSEISYLRSDTKYTTVVTPDGSFLLRTPLRQMCEKLDPRVFWQIHRGIVVNMAAIDTIYRTFRGRLEVKLKGREELLPVSAAHAHLFRELQ